MASSTGADVVITEIGGTTGDIESPVSYTHLRQLRQIEVKQQAPDHPILWGVPETNYLKFFLFRLFDDDLKIAPLRSAIH